MKLYTYFIMTVVAILMLLPSNTFTQINLSKVDTHQSGQGIPSGIKREQKKETPIIETKIDPSQSGQGIPSGIKQERKKETPIIETKIDSSQSGQGIPHGIKQEQKKKSPIIDSSGFKKKHNLISIVNYNVYDCYWGDAIDGDGDGYTRYRKLYTDVDVDDGSTRSIYLKIYRKLATSSTYSLYFTTPNYQITGTSSDDWIWVAIGLPNPELDHNIYDFKSEAYEAGGSTVVASRDADADADLNDESFETASQDVSGIYSVYDCYWGDAVDGDGDGYTRYRKLYSDVDVNDGSTRSIYLKIYRKLATSSTYSLYYTTSNYQITGTSGDDWIWVAIGLPNPELDHNIYDFKSEAYEAGGSTVVASRDADADTDLNDKWFETASQDVSGIYSVYDCYWGDAIDGDGDGYTRYRKLYTDVDVNDGSTRSIYLKIYRKLATSPTYSLYYTTPNYQITGTSGDDWIWVAIGLPNPELDHNIYDFKSEAYEAGGSAVVASRDADTDTDLNDKWFETASQDVPNSVNETEITLSDKYILTENYPNPFNPTTNFKFQIKKNGFVTLNIFDMLGKEIAVLVKEELHAGVYSTTWNAINTISGVYFYRLQVSEEGKNVFTETKKLVLMK